MTQIDQERCVACGTRWSGRFGETELFCGYCGMYWSSKNDSLFRQWAGDYIEVYWSLPEETSIIVITDRHNYRRERIVMPQLPFDISAKRLLALLPFS